MDFLKVVDKYYHINCVTDTYCSKCDELEENFVCKKCGGNNSINNLINNDNTIYRDDFINYTFDRFMNLNIKLQELLLIIQQLNYYLENKM
tara:strand:- start:3432 stop:3704 length:273 start_codon:yes stop_codon:yes gene_type:complete